MDAKSDVKTTRTAQQTALLKINRALLPICCVMIGFCYLDRSNIAYAAISLRKPPPVGISMTDKTYGTGSGSFFIGYSLFQIPSNLILCRVGAPRWLATIVVLWGLLATAMAAMTNATDFIVLRLLLGVAESGTFPGLWYHMSLFYPNESLTMPITVTKVAVLIAQVVSAPLAACLISLHGLHGLAGWQWLFLLEGLPTILVGFSLLLFMPPSPTAVSTLTPAELTWIQQGVVMPPTTPQLLKGLWSCLFHGQLWWLTLAFAIKSSASYSLMFWCPLIIDDLLGPSRKGGLTAILLTSVPYAFSAAFSYWQGWSSQLRQERRLHTAVPFMLSGMLLMTSPLLRGRDAALAAFAVLCVGVACANGTGPLTAMVSGVLPSNQQAAGLALWNSVANVGGYVGPAAFGYIKSRTKSNDVAMAVLGMCLITAGLMVWWFHDPLSSGSAIKRQRSDPSSAAKRGNALSNFLDMKKKPRHAAAEQPLVRGASTSF